MTGAHVTITNMATGLTRAANTDASGAFVFSLLPVGNYSLAVEQAGIRKFERNENIQADASMQIGNVQETVTVEATSAQVDTRSATLNHTVDSRRVVELPLSTLR